MPVNVFDFHQHIAVWNELCWKFQHSKLRKTKWRSNKKTRFLYKRTRIS